VNEFRFKAHSVKQQELILSDAELTIAGTGTQWGKSQAGSLWIKHQIGRITESDSNFLLASPSYKIMNQSMIPYFLFNMEGFGRYNKGEAVFEMRDRRRVYLRTETDQDSIVGIPKVKAGWLDEAGKMRLYFWENYLARAASDGAKTLLTTSPYSLNWLWRSYIKPKLAGLMPEIKLIQAASWENPYHTLSDPIKRKQMQAQMDPRRYAMLFGGEWGKHAGLVYDCFDDAENICADTRLPNGTQYYAGIDWGHTEPFVIVVRAITPDNLHYQVSEFYKTGMTVPSQMEIAKQKMATYNIRQFFCGHERPENILLFNQNGLPCVPVPEKDIQVGTDLHYELIKTRRYKIFENTSPHSLDEYETYHYPEPEDLKPDQESRDQKPVGQNDHCMSANRFVTLRTYRSGSRNRPFTPDEKTGKAETQANRLKRLMQPGSRRNSHTENWS
jgi:hypothetical protein